MRNISKILFVFLFSITVQVGYANTVGVEGGKDSKAGVGVRDEEQTGNQKSSKENSDLNQPAESEVGTIHVDQDSLDDDSVNKYNFIFYFLYKFKYDHEERP